LSIGSNSDGMSNRIILDDTHIRREETHIPCEIICCLFAFAYRMLFFFLPAQSIIHTMKDICKESNH
jgi:hypothetical protein